MDNVNKTSYTFEELKSLKLEYSEDECLKNLQNPLCEDFVKIFSIINLKSLNSLEVTQLLFEHLTDKPTPIREAASLKIEELYCDDFFDDFIKNRFLKAIIDINPNVSRAVCSAISKSDKLKNALETDIISKIRELLFEISEYEKKSHDNFYNKNSKSHAKNKKIFSLYWFLEALGICFSGKNNSQVLEILKTTINFSDYTIREKTAKILAMIDDLPDDIVEIIKFEQNFYVKNQVYGKIDFED